MSARWLIQSIQPIIAAQLSQPLSVCGSNVAFMNLMSELAIKIATHSRGCCTLPIIPQLRSGLEIAYQQGRCAYKLRGRHRQKEVSRARTFRLAG